MKNFKPLLLVAALAAALPALPVAALEPVAAPASAPAATPAAARADAQFNALAQRALAAWFRASPSNATFIGMHAHDAELDDLSAAGRARAVAADKSLLAALDRLPAARLSRENQVDAAILRNQLQLNLWNAEVYEDWARDPQVYGGIAGNALYNLMARDFAPLPQRLRAATRRMEAMPGLFAEERANLDPARVPKVFAETVAQQNGGLKQIVAAFIAPHLDALQGAERARLEAAIKTFDAAVDARQAWLDGTLVPNSRGDFRLGAKRYDEKLHFALMSSLSRAEIKQRAEAELASVRGRMYEISRGLLKDRLPAEQLPEQPTPAQQQAAIEAALELAYAERPAPDHLVADATADLQQARQFVIDHQLVSVPATPVRIIEMPEFQQGVTAAYCDSPGPLDRSLPTYYAISPIPKGWTQAQVDSYLREYNSRMLQLLSIHEGMPGHYLEGAHSAEYPSTLRAVLRSGLFAEGWAVYMERTMREEGYLDHDPLFELVQLKFYLRTIGNAILDQGVQVEGWTREQAMDFMVRQTFQQEREAAGKWVRAELTSAQLPTYFVGVQEQLDMRRAVAQAWGPRFTLLRYHDAVLSYGAPPPRFVRELLLDEPIR